jgi:hypothetical protein
MMAVVVCGCFDPRPSTGGACAPGSRCPAPLQCIADVCTDSNGVDGPDARGLDPDAAAGPLVCPTGYGPVIPGSCHRSVLLPAPWLEAEVVCAMDGAHLVVPNSVAESAAIKRPTWVGVSDRRVEGAFLTVTGRIPSFIYWAPSEPSTEDCVFGSGASLWIVRPCDAALPYFCEYDGVKSDPSAY